MSRQVTLFRLHDHPPTTTTTPAPPPNTTIITTTPWVYSKDNPCSTRLDDLATRASPICAWITCSILITMILINLLKTLLTAGKGIFDLRIQGISFPQRPELLVLVFSTTPAIITIIARPLIPPDHAIFKYFIYHWGVCQTLRVMDLFSRTAAMYHMIYWVNRMPLLCFIYWIYRLIRFGRLKVMEERRQYLERKAKAKAEAEAKAEQERLAFIAAAEAAAQEEEEKNQDKKRYKRSNNPWTTQEVAPVIEPPVPPPFIYKEEPDEARVAFYRLVKWIIPPIIYFASFCASVPVVMSYERLNRTGTDNPNDPPGCNITGPYDVKYHYYEFFGLIAIPLVAQTLAFYKSALGKSKVLYKIRCYYIVFIFLTIPYFVLFIILEMFKKDGEYGEICSSRFGNGILISITAYHICFAVKPIVYLTACNCIPCSDTCLEDHPTLDYYIEFWITPQEKKKTYFKEEGQGKQPLLGPHARAKMHALAVLAAAAREEALRRQEEEEEFEMPTGKQRFTETRLIITAKGPQLVRKK